MDEDGAGRINDVDCQGDDQSVSKKRKYGQSSSPSTEKQSAGSDNIEVTDSVDKTTTRPRKRKAFNIRYRD